MHRTNPVPRSPLALILLGLAIGPFATQRVAAAADGTEGVRPPDAAEAVAGADLVAAAQEQAPAPRPQPAAPAPPGPGGVAPAANVVVVPIGATRTITMKANLPIRTVINAREDIATVQSQPNDLR